MADEEGDLLVAADAIWISYEMPITDYLSDTAGSRSNTLQRMRKETFRSAGCKLGLYLGW